MRFRLAAKLSPIALTRKKKMGTLLIPAKCGGIQKKNRSERNLEVEKMISLNSISFNSTDRQKSKINATLVLTTGCAMFDFSFADFILFFFEEKMYRRHLSRNG